MAIAAPYTPADFPPRVSDPLNPCVGTNPDGSFYIEDVEIYGYLDQIIGAGFLATPFNPGDTTMSLVNANSFPNSCLSGMLRMGTSAGQSATLTVDGVTYVAIPTGTAGQAIRVRHIPGGALAVSRSGNDITVTFAAGTTAKAAAKLVAAGTTPGSGSYAPGFAGELLDASAGAGVLTATTGFANLVGGVDAGIEYLEYATKVGNNLGGVTASAKAWPAGTRVRAHMPVHLSNIKISSPQVYGFDDTAEAKLIGDCDLNALPGMDVALLTLGTVNYSTTPGEIGNSRAMTYINPRKNNAVETVYAATLTTPAALPNAQMIFGTKIDGGVQITLEFVELAGTNPLVISSPSGQPIITVSLATTGGVSTSTAADIVAAWPASAANGKSACYLAPGSDGSGVVHAMSKRHMVEEFAIALKTGPTGTITSTGTSVAATANANGRLTNYISVSGGTSALVAETARTYFLGGVGGTLYITAAMPVPSGGDARVFARVGPWGITYTNYLTDVPGGGPRLVGVSPAVNTSPPIGVSQLVADNDPIKPVYPYGLMQLEKTAINLNAGTWENVWIHYTGGDPGVSLSDLVYIHNWAYEGFVGDGLQFGGAGGADTIHAKSINIFANPTTPHGHNAALHFDNLQVNYCSNVLFEDAWVWVARNSILFGSPAGANDYPANEVVNFVWRRCGFYGSDPGAGDVGYGLRFPSIASAVGRAGKGCGGINCYFNKDSFEGSSQGGVEWSGNHSEDVKQNIRYDTGETVVY